MAHTVFTFGFKCRDHSFGVVVYVEEEMPAQEGSLWQSPGRSGIGLYFPSVNPAEQITGTELLQGGLFRLVQPRGANSLSGGRYHTS